MKNGAGFAGPALFMVVYARDQAIFSTASGAWFS